MYEPCYFGSIHKRCLEWKTPHLGGCRDWQQWKLKMRSTSLLWTTLDYMLKEIKNDDKTFFIPSMFITDESGTNSNATLIVYGEKRCEEIHSMSISFQRVLAANDVAQVLPDLDEQKAEFEEVMTQMLTVPTISEFQELKSRVV